MDEYNTPAAPQHQPHHQGHNAHYQPDAWQQPAPLQPEPQPIYQQPQPQYQPQPTVVPMPMGPPEPPQDTFSGGETAASLPGGGINPVAVIQVLSTRGVEYFMLTIMLWSCAIDLGWILLALINGGAHFDVLSFPVASLLVSLPVFAYLFLRLKKAELANPALRLEPSKRRLTQITQIVTFLICFFNLVAFVYLIMADIAGQVDYAFWKIFLDVVIILGIAGGILAYYWYDEHRNGR